MILTATLLAFALHQRLRMVSGIHRTVVVWPMAAKTLAAGAGDYQRLQHLLSVMKADPLMVFFTSEGILFARDGSPQGWLFAKDGEGWNAKMVPVRG